MAVKTVSNIGGNWNAAATWSPAGVPATIDTIVFTSTSGPLTVNVVSTCAGIDFTNYVNTVTFTSILTVAGPVNLGTGGYTQAGANGITVNATATHTSGGVTWTRPWTFTGASRIYTMSGIWTFTGALTFSGTTATTLNGSTINTANLTVTTTATISGTTNIVFNNSGTWSHTAVGVLRNNVTVNTASTLTLGANVYWNTGIFTHLSGNVDTTTNANTFNCQSGTIDAANVTWNNFYFSSNGSNVLALSNTLNVLRDFTVGGQGTISGAFDIYCGNHNVSNASSGATNVVVTHSGIIYCSNNLTYSGASNTCRHSGTVYVGGSVAFNAPATASQGSLNLYMVGNGTISALSTAYPIISNIYFDTPGRIKITTPLVFTNGTAKTINLIRGKVDGSKCDLYLNQSFNHTLINMHKIIWRGIYLAANASLTMNEFFCGRPDLRTVVASTVATNYTVNFTDNFEKIAKFVNIRNCTLARPQQLLVLTDTVKSSTNTRGIRYINSLPNGVAKGDPSIPNILSPGLSSFLVPDPSMEVK